MKAQKVLSSMVMLTAALTLAGCAKSSSAPATNESHVRSAKVTKAPSHKAAKTDKAAAKGSKQAASASSSVTSSSAAKISSTSNSQNKAVANSQSESSQATAPAAASRATMAHSSANASSVNANSHSEAVQLGLGDTAVWTDSQGVTHHVNSDGLDKQTSKNSNSVSYSDWSGSLPQGVKVEHN